MTDQDLQFAQTVQAEEEWHEHNQKLLDQIVEIGREIQTSGKAWNERMKDLNKQTNSVPF